MTLTDVYCPPIPSWWQAPPSVVVRKWNVPDVEKVAPVKKELTEEERKRLMIIADKCPIHKILSNPIKIVTS